MVVMITPVAFSSIGYQTYIIFAVINAAIVPCVYFFFPETAYRSLEEMDSIFRKTKSIFSLVKTAKNEPHHYGKNGELLIAHDQMSQRSTATSMTRTDGEGGSWRANRGYDGDQEKGTKDFVNSSGDGSPA